MVRNLTSGDQSNHRHARYEATSRGHPPHYERYLCDFDDDDIPY